MKRLSLFLLIAMLLAGVAVGGISTPSYAQGYPVYNYPPPPRVLTRLLGWAPIRRGPITTAIGS